MADSRKRSSSREVITLGDSPMSPDSPDVVVTLQDGMDHVLRQCMSHHELLAVLAEENKIRDNVQRIDRRLRERREGLYMKLLTNPADGNLRAVLESLDKTITNAGSYGFTPNDIGYQYGVMPALTSLPPTPPQLLSRPTGPPPPLLPGDSDVWICRVCRDPRRRQQREREAEKGESSSSGLTSNDPPSTPKKRKSLA